APRTPSAGEPPRARVERWRPSSSPSVAAASPEVAAAPTAAPPPAVAGPAPEGAPPPATQGASAGSSQTEPGGGLRAIGHATAPEKRAATLTIDGAPPMTLRQGESAGGIEVQLILRESVYVRHGPDVYAVGVDR